MLVRPIRMGRTIPIEVKMRGEPDLRLDAIGTLQSTARTRRSVSVRAEKVSHCLGASAARGPDEVLQHPSAHRYCGLCTRYPRTLHHNLGSNFRSCSPMIPICRSWTFCWGVTAPDGLALELVHGAWSARGGPGGLLAGRPVTVCLDPLRTSGQRARQRQVEDGDGLP